LIASSRDNVRVPDTHAFERPHASRTAFAFDGVTASDGPGVPTAVQVLPLPPSDGLLVARDGRNVRISDAAALVAASNAELDRLGNRAPVDMDHDILYRGGGPAVGWASGFELRADGIYAVGIEWLAEGRDAIAAKKYGFTSVVMEAERVVLEENDWGWPMKWELRPTLLTGFALTNIPAMRNKALFTKDHTIMAKTPFAALLVALSLPQDASPEDVEGAVAKLSTENKDLREKLSAAPKLTDYVPRADFDALNERFTAASKLLLEAEEAGRKAAIDAVLEKFSARIPPATRDYHRKVMERGGAEAVADFEAFAATLPEIAGAVVLTTKPNEVTLSDAEKKVAALMNLTHDEYAAQKKPAKT